MKQLGLIGMTVLGVTFLFVQVCAGEEAALKSEKDKINYGMGVNVARSFKQQGMDVDLDVVIQGMKDAFSGEKILISDEELRKIMNSVQTEVRRRQKLAPILAAQEGQAFLAENGKKEGVATLASGLQYKVLKKGDGRKPTGKDLVLCNYRGTLLSGETFDRSYPGHPATFKVEEGGGMPGLSEALKLMPVGSSWQLFIPSQLAYGDRGRSSVIGSPVRPNETIILEVELLAIQ